jgi:hypothetical protein
MASKQDPLSYMTNLSEWVSVYRPEAGSAASPDGAPCLVIILAWMGARKAHLAKFVKAYQDLYPSAQILLLKNTLKHLVWQPGVPSADFKPAVTVIRSAISSSRTDASSPKILVHSFSNNGSAVLSHLRRAYGNPFPPHVTVYDSGPGQFSARRATTAMTMGIPVPFNWVAYPITMFLTGVAYRLWYIGRPDGQRQHASVNNAVEGELRRVYVYSEVDKIVDWRHIEAHADEAEAKGYKVRREKFEGTPHISHMRADEERYWAIVTETWQGKPGPRL